MTSSTLFSTQPIDFQTDENSNPKSKDCLSLKPSRELSFFHSKNRYTADLQLLNKKDEPVLYKIRTTAAKNYIVLPTAGLIPPRGVATVKIHMPAKEEIRERANDKFLVQAFVYNKNDLGDDQKIMNQVFEQHYKTLSSKELQSAKLRVYFDSHTVIEEEMSEETGSVQHYSPSTAMTRDAPESASALFASKPQSAPSTAIKTTLLPEALTRSEMKPSEDLLTQILKDERLDALSESSNRNRVDSLRTMTSEPYVYQIYSDKSRVCETEAVLPSQKEAEAAKVSRNLKNEFEKDATKRNSLSNITNSLPRSFTSFPDNDTSMYTDISDVKSNMSFSEQLAAYKYKLDLLERKYNEQNAQMARLLQERETHQQEAMTFRRSSMSFSTPADETKSQQNNKTQLDVWHMIVLCIVCMILGSLFR